MAEQITPRERDVLLQALRKVGTGLTTPDSKEPFSQQEVDDLADALASQEVLIFSWPGEKLFSVPVRLTVSAVDADTAAIEVAAFLGAAVFDQDCNPLNTILLWERGATEVKPA